MKKRVTLTFPKRAIQMPVAYRLAKDFNVAANIIRAQVAPNQIGKLVVELSGDIDELDASNQRMHLRVFKYRRQIRKSLSMRMSVSIVGYVLGSVRWKP